MRPLHRAPLAVLMTCFAVGVAACGTTVHGQFANPTGATSLGTNGSGGAGGTVGAGASGSGANGGTTAFGSSGTTGSNVGQSNGNATTSSNGGSGSGATLNGGEVGDGPGVTATTINVAAAYDPDAAAADSALGAANANPGDTKAEQEALFKYINEHGGIAGRKVNPIWYQASVKDNTTTTDEQACQTWTKDNKTFVIAGGTPIFDQCTADAKGIGLIAGAIVLGTKQVEKRYPMVVNLTGFGIDTAMSTTVNGLAKQGYFSKGSKVGIATWDDTSYHYGISNRALPALAAVGQTNVPVEYITVPQSYGGLSSTSASISSAVLKFASQGIDHVLLFDGAAGINNSGILVLEWMQQANSQHYYPRYGLNSTSGFNALASDYPQQELVNSVGIDWTPALSLTAGDYAKYPLPPNGKLCLKIMAAAGQQQSGANAQAIQQGLCETFFFLKRALDTVKGPLNQQTALAAINAMGAAYPSAVTYGIDITSAHHSGATLVRNMAYQSGCQCFKQTSGSYDPGGS